MDLEYVKKHCLEGDGLSDTLGIEYLSTPESDVCVGRMPVDNRNCQPYGYLSGGASLALAENVAGIGSMALCPDKMCLGINVSGDHVKSARVGDTVTATARILHQGRSLHLWGVEVRNGKGELVSSVQVKNFVMDKKA